MDIYVGKRILEFPFVVSVFVSFCYGDFVFADGVVHVSERGQLAGYRAVGKYKIATTKGNEHVENEWKYKNSFPEITLNIQLKFDHISKAHKAYSAQNEQKKKNEPAKVNNEGTTE